MCDRHRRMCMEADATGGRTCDLTSSRAAHVHIAERSRQGRTMKHVPVLIVLAIAMPVISTSAEAQRASVTVETNHGRRGHSMRTATRRRSATVEVNGMGNARRTRTTTVQTTRHPRMQHRVRTAMHTRTRVVVQTPRSAPPPPPRYRRPRQPGNNYVWIEGSYQWQNGAYVWQRGRWERQRVGYRHEPGRWVLQGDTYVFVQPQWIQVQVQAPPPAPPPRATVVVTAPAPRPAVVVQRRRARPRSRTVTVTTTR